MLYARVLHTSGKRQTLKEHSEHVAFLAARAARRVGLSALMRLAGLLHDAGKAAVAVQLYLADPDGVRGSVEHSAYGAVYAYLRWHTGNAMRLLTAELIAFAIASHHGRLPDLLDEDGVSFSEEKLTALRFDDQNEVMAAFLAEVAEEETLDALFAQAVTEVEMLYRQLVTAVADLATKGNVPRKLATLNLLGLVQRSVYSLLIDADRWDAYCYEAERDPTAETPAPWAAWQERLETRLAGLDQTTALNRLRAEVSAECLRAASLGPGLYRLAVPTGGGKTYASLRYALELARQREMARVVYAAPYKAILTQTADTVRKALLTEDAPQAEADLILEHHGDALPGGADSEQVSRYQLISGRWDAPLVLTTMAQLLNTLFAGPSACARRFSALHGSVLILDEAQSIPLRCMELFTMALRYLANVCGCAVVLCTATPPLLDELERLPLPKPTQMIANEAALHESFRRVRLIDRTETELAPEALALQVLAQPQQAVSALLVMNTKAMAREVAQAFRERAPEDVPVYCLTTAQCPAHRCVLLEEIKARLKACLSVVCVSTQLIEAGVDISFRLVVRALAGLDSVVQAAGRGNRNAELPMGEAWLVRVAGESLRGLPDIQIGRDETLQLLSLFRADPARFGGDLLSPKLVEAYFRRILRVHAGEMAYPTQNGTLVDLLSGNARGCAAYQDAHGRAYTGGVLRQAFRTAGASFAALDGAPCSLLAPYGKGRELITRLTETTELARAKRLLREAQRYMVAVYPNQIQALQREHGIQPLPAAGCYALDERFYDAAVGVTLQGKEMAFYDV